MTVNPLNDAQLYGFRRTACASNQTVTATIVLSIEFVVWKLRKSRSKHDESSSSSNKLKSSIKTNYLRRLRHAKQSSGWSRLLERVLTSQPTSQAVAHMLRQYNDSTRHKATAAWFHYYQSFLFRWLLQLLHRAMRTMCDVVRLWSTMFCAAVANLIQRRCRRRRSTLDKLSQCASKCHSLFACLQQSIQIIVQRWCVAVRCVRVGSWFITLIASFSIGTAGN